MDYTAVQKSFENFYSNFDKNYLKVLDIDINRLKELQIKNFLETFGKSEKIIKERYTELASLHFNLGISCFEYLDCFEKVKNNLLEEILILKEFEIEFFKKFYSFFNHVKNCTSFYYLKKLIDEDYFLINNYVSCSKDNEAKNAIIEHLNWIQQILIKIKNPKKNVQLELDSERCLFSKWLENPELTYFLNEYTKEEIKKIHNQIHILAEEIFYYLREKDYFKILVRYPYFLKKSEFLVLIIMSQVAEYEIKTSIIDPMTKTLNRKNLEKILTNTIETSYYSRQPLTIAMIDIDNFKEINDTYGHQAGDKVLKEIANLIKNNIRNSDFLFRYGGEEFLIILNGADEKAGYAVAEKIRKKIEEANFNLKGKNIKITVSIGLNTIRVNRKKVNLFEFVERADLNLYKAKKLGKNKVIK